jgi:hypothetical protein
LTFPKGREEEIYRDNKIEGIRKTKNRNHEATRIDGEENSFGPIFRYLLCALSALCVNIFLA